MMMTNGMSSIGIGKELCHGERAMLRKYGNLRAFPHPRPHAEALRALEGLAQAEMTRTCMRQMGSHFYPIDSQL